MVVFDVYCSDCMNEHDFISLFQRNIVSLQQETLIIGGMCTLKVRMDDNVLNLVKPHFKGDEAMQLWIEKQLHNVLLEYAKQFDKISDVDNIMVVQQVKALEKDPIGLLKLGSVLRPSKYNAEELKDEYVSEKYGI